MGGAAAVQPLGRQAGPLQLNARGGMRRPRLWSVSGRTMLLWPHVAARCQCTSMHAWMRGCPALPMPTARARLQSTCACWPPRPWHSRLPLLLGTALARPAAAQVSKAASSAKDVFFAELSHALSRGLRHVVAPPTATWHHQVRRPRRSLAPLCRLIATAYAVPDGTL